jgi:hypothetical protein
MIPFVLAAMNIGLLEAGFLPIQRAELPIPLDYDEVAMERWPGLISITEAPGSGDPAEEGDRVTVHFQVSDGFGKEIADSRKRGLPYTAELATFDFWSKLALGMAPGQKRWVYLPPELGFGENGVAGVVPGNSELYILVELLHVARGSSRREVRR